MKHFPLLISMTALLLGITGCGKQEEEVPSPPLVPTGVMVPTAQVEAVHLKLPNILSECILEESYFYVSKDLETDGAGDKTTVVSFCRRDLDSFEEETLLLKQADGSCVKQAVLDAGANLYELLFSEEEQAYYVGKWDCSGKQLYMLPVTELSQDTLADAAGCTVDAAGRLCLYTWEGSVFVFDSRGRLTGQWESGMPLAENGFFVSGMDGFYWYQDMGGELLFYYLNEESGQFTAQISFPYDGDEAGILQVFGALDCIWIATGQSLYCFDLQENTPEKILSWKNPYINLDGGNLRLLGENSLKELVLLFQKIDASGFTLYEKAVISWADEGLLPQKETITLGTMLINGQPTADVEETVRQFNRYSQKYCVELVHYFPRDETGEIMENVYLDILQGQAPDLIDVSALDVASLADKEVFENLEPYLKDSQVIQKENILENVWEEGQIGGKFRLVIPFFRVNTYVSHAPAPGQGWTFEEFTQYAAAHPDTPLVVYMSYRQALGIALFAGMDSFVDYERGKCNFTDASFSALLTEIRDMCMIQTGPMEDSVTVEEFQSFFEEGAVLLQEISFGSTEEFLLLQQQYGSASSWKGYPSLSGEPYHKMSSQLRLSMNSASKNKEGAWAFLEFLLSRENQERSRLLASFPVRKDSFEQYIRTSAQTAEPEKIDASAQDIALLVETIQASHMDNRNIDDDVFRIVCEESEAFFAGDKTVEEVTGLIQNRVQLYLSERYR